jgi:hypothetical protein
MQTQWRIVGVCTEVRVLDTRLSSTKARQTCKASLHSLGVRLLAFMWIFQESSVDQKSQNKGFTATSMEVSMVITITANTFIEVAR